jgi:cyanophycinase-like exopeptidase
MARLQRFHQVSQAVTIACGATDGTNVIDLAVPFDGAILDRFSATQKVVGSGTGTFVVGISEFTSTGTSVGRSNTITVTAAALGNTVHGNALGYGTQAGVTNSGICVTMGNRLAVTTTKTGTVTANATLVLNLLWLM